MWNYWNYCCGIVFVTGIKTTICCGMEWLVSFGGAYEPVGQGFESLPARHKKQYNFGCTVFYFVHNLQGLEPPLGEAEHNRDSRSERWAEPIESLPARHRKPLIPLGFSGFYFFLKSQFNCFDHKFAHL